MGGARKMPVILLVNATEHIVVDVTPGTKIQKKLNKNCTMFRESWMISDGSSLFLIFTTRPFVIPNINNQAQRLEFVVHHQIIS